MSSSVQTRQRRRSPSPERVKSVRKRHLQLLAILVVMVFASTLGGGFVWNDNSDLVSGAYRIDSLRDIHAALTLTGEEFRALTLDRPVPEDNRTWQPLVIFANTLSWSLWGDCAFCFHLENLLLHLALVIGIYALGRHLLSHRRHGNRIAVWAAALYAVHPATVNSVAWIGGQSTLLAAAFSVWTLVIFTRLQATTRSTPGHFRRWLLGLLFTSTCAMLSHASAMMLPLLALYVATFEAMERGRHPFGGISPKRMKGLGVLLAVTVLMAAYRVQVIGSMQLFVGHPADGFFNNLGTAVRHFWFLVGEAVLPGEPIVSDAWEITKRWGSAEVASLLGLFALVAITVLGLRAHHPSALGVGWFLLWLLPGAALFPGSHYHDSQVLYLAVWGLALAAAYAMLQLWRPVGRQLMPGSEAIMYMPLIIILGVVTAFSNVRWWNQRGLFESEVISDPLFIEGRVELAKAVLEAGDPILAADHLATAIQASQDDSFTGYFPAFDAHLLLGRAQLELGKHDDAAASFAQAEKMSPRHAEVVYWFGMTDLYAGRYEDAEARFREAMQLRPGYLDAESDLGAALVGQGRYVEAYPLLEAAIANNRGNARRHGAMAMIHIEAGRLDDAARELEAALAARNDPKVRARLAWVRWQQGDKEQAREQVKQAMDDVQPGRAADYVDEVARQVMPDTRENSEEPASRGAAE